MTIYKKTIMDKAVMRATNNGGVPLVNGKYGMTVEEYLQWVANRKRKREELKMSVPSMVLPGERAGLPLLQEEKDAMRKL